MGAALLAVALLAPAGVASAPGHRAYLRYCATCHGVTGAGDGPTARWLDPPPRAFTRGVYRWRSTPGGAPPTDADLLRTIDEGVPGTSMPGWRYWLPQATRAALVQYLRVAFPEGFDPSDVRPAIVVPDPPAASPDLLTRGAEVYVSAGCVSCHGPSGRGDGEAAAGLKDARAAPSRRVTSRGR